MLEPSQAGNKSIFIGGIGMICPQDKYEYNQLKRYMVKNNVEIFLNIWRRETDGKFKLISVV